MRISDFTINGDLVMRLKNTGGRYANLLALLVLIVVVLPMPVLAQGSIYGTVQNSDLSTPANGEISFFGYLDDTDEEIRIETSTGAGYDNGNWFDDFQNYLTEAPGNPYDHHFYNVANSEGYHLEDLIPNNSFQEENIQLALVSWPAQPTGLTAIAISSTAVLVEWNGVPGLTYHVYRRDATSNGSFFRLDNTAGLLTDPGVSDSFFVDTTTDGVSSYDYLIIAEDISGNYSQHSAFVTVNSSSLSAPDVNSIDPDSGMYTGGTFVNIYGSDFDMAGADAVVETSSLTGVVVVSPYHITGTTQAGTQGSADVYVTNTASGLVSNTLVGGYTYTGNHAPVLAAIGLQSTTEGVNLNFGVSASDPDGTTPTLTTSTLPNGAVFVDSGNGDGSFDWTPDYTQSGTYNVTFYATDDFSAVDSEIVTITVNEAGNQPPVLSSIGMQSTTEGVNLNFGVSASDIESIPALTTSTLPTGATFADNLDGTGTFDWTPDFTQAGTYFVTFYATDDSSTVDSEVVQIDVGDAGNQPPLLDPIGGQGTTEGVNLNFGVSASDPDTTTPTLSTSTLPTGAMFTDNSDGTGTFDWTPDYIQSGSYNVTFYATDGFATDSEIVTIDVTEAGNKPPVLSPIGAQGTTEGINLNFGVSASDVESIPSLTTSTLPTGATFVDNHDGTGTFDWIPDYTQASSYDVTFYATDDSSAVDSEIVTIDVAEAGNQPPVLSSIGTQSTVEGVNLNFGVSASDIESIPSLTTSTLPTGATFVDNLDGTGTFDWTPDYDQSGTYFVTFYATDDSSAVDSEGVQIDVTEAGNQPPVLDPIGAQSTTEGVNLNFGVSASDVESIPSLTTSTLPTGATFADNLDGTGDFDWTPDFTQAGTYFVTFYATDDSLAVDSEIVQIDVGDAGNQPPVLDPIGTQSTTEGVNLSFGVSVSDPDTTTPTLSTSTLPTGALFTDNGDGTGTFDWTPDYIQSGSYNITFYANDGFATDSEVVQIDVAEAGNQYPVLNPIGVQSTLENVQLLFGVSATDAESVPTLTTSTLPSGAIFVDSGNGSGSFDWTPDYTQSGSYNVTFYTTDDSSAVDSEIVTIDVAEAGNQPPVLSSIGTQSTTEGVNLNFGVSASDVESIPSLTTSTLPTGAAFVDNLDGTGTFDWTPDFTQAGSYNVTFYTTDDSLAVDSEVVQIDVGDAGNQPPVLDPIGAQSTTEGINLNFGVSASDPDVITPTLSTSTLPTGALFTDNGDGTGTFDWTPDYIQSGSYNVTFYASDGFATDSEVVTIDVVEAGNQPPVLDSIGPQSAAEGVNMNLEVSASDVDGTTLSLSTSTLPSGASFTDNGDGTGMFDWMPDFTQSGTYYVTFYATDDSSTVDSEIVTIDVAESGNQPPVLSPIGMQSTTEGINLNFGISASDAESIPSLTTSTLPTGATFVDNLDGNGTFDWTPDFTQAGSYNVTFYTTDDSLAVDSEVVQIDVGDAGNQPPVLDPIGAQSTTEGINLNFGVSASDPDVITPTLSTSTLPTGALFTDNGDGTGTFDWTPDYIQSGSYNVTFYASDGFATDSEVVTIDIIEAGNQPPVLDSIGPQSATEGVNMNLGVSASDVDGTTLSLSTSTLPTGALFTDNGDGTGTFDWTPDFTQASSYNVTFYATDDSSAVDSEIVTIDVAESGNQPPVLSPIGMQSTTEGINLNFGISASDAESIPSLTTSTLPTGATFVDNLDGTGTFDWIPDFTQAGTYFVTFYATDDSSVVDSEVVQIDVGDAGNQPPLLDPIGAQSTTEGVNLNFGVSASDPDGATPTLSTSTLPTGALFTDNGDGTGTFDWTPDYIQSGSYNITFYASDGFATDSEVVQIDVTEAGNQPPVLDSIGPQSATEGVNMNLGVSASDVDGTTLSLSTSTLPTGALFTDNGDGTGTFDWTPDFTQASSYNVTFYATDDSSAVDSEIVTIDVVEGGNPPVLNPIGDQSTTEGVQLVFGVLANDPDGTIPTLSTSSLPTGALFVDSGNGAGSFDWTPDYTQSGAYDVTFYASDGQSIDSEIVSIDVAEAGNQPPVLDSIGPRTVIEGTQLIILVSASDPEGAIPTLSTSTFPPGASFVDSGNGTGSFDWTPDFTQAGTYFVTFYATDDSSATDSEDVTIIVAESGNQAPVIDSIADTTVNEGDTLVINVSATDPEGNSITLSINAPLNNYTFVDNGDGTGVFTYHPDYFDAGSDSIRFIATDDGTPEASSIETVIVTTADVNQPPEFEPVGPFGVEVNDTLEFIVTATDSTDLLPTARLYLSVISPPANSQFVDNGDNTGTYTFMPVAGQEGVDTVTFLAIDEGTPALTGSLPVEITVVAINTPPVLDSIGPQFVSEGETLTVNISATDPDGTTPTLEADNTPENSSFTDNGDGTGVFTFTPSFIQSGLYYVTFKAYDGIDIDKEVVLVQVLEAGNQVPVFDSIPSLSVVEADTAIDIVMAHDPDGESITITFDSITVPVNFTWVDSGNGVASFMFTPDYSQSGTYYVDVIASDGSLADTATVAIDVVEAGNQEPVLDSIPDQTIVESHTLSFTVTANDPDSTPPKLYSSSLPGSASFDTAYGSQQFAWETGWDDSGTYQITFYAEDSLYPAIIDSQLVTITVVDSNRAPWILVTQTMPDTLWEGDTLSFLVIAWDDDGPAPIIDAFLNGTDSLAWNMTLYDSGNGNGVFTFIPDYSQGDDDPNRYYVVFRTCDSADPTLCRQTGASSNTIKVYDYNQAPVMVFSAGTGPFNIVEGDSLVFDVSATDPDGPPPTLDTADFPPNATFEFSFQNSGTFRFYPDYTQAGQYLPQFIALDVEGLADTQQIVINVADVGNQPPVLDSIGPKSTVEAVQLTFDISASDPDGTTPTLSTSALPTGASFVDNSDGTGTFDWTPGFTQAGTYNITFYATDAFSEADSEVVAITVLEVGNQAPVLNPIGAKSATEEVNLNFSVTASDPDGTTPNLSTSTLPSGASFVDAGDGTGTFDWTPNYIQSGTYNVTFYAGDGQYTDSEIVTIDVAEVGNQMPVLNPIGAKNTTEGVQLTFGVSASDAESIPALTASSLPSGATFVDNLNGTGTFIWSPGYTQSGVYHVTFYATDDSTAVDSEIVMIGVAEAGNQPPVLDSIGPKSIGEGVELIFNVSASDPDGTTPTLSTSTLPTGASFVDNLNDTGTFNWTPGYTQAGVYNVTFYATDGTETDSEIVVITVNDVNQPPVLDPIGSKSTTESVQLTFTVSASDPDGTTPSLSTSTLPTGASFVDNGNGTGGFDWTPDYTQSGTYNVTFYASDGQAADSEVIQIDVAEAGNQSPVLAPIGPQSTTEGVLLTFGVSANDPDGTIPSLSTSTLPSGASFVDAGDGTGTFDWTPNFTQAGTYNLTFYATDDSASVDSEIVTIDVAEASNQPPAFTTVLPDTIDVYGSIQSQTVVEATDPDLDPITLTATLLPGANFDTTGGNGTGTYYYTPDTTDIGSIFQVTFVATDPSAEADTLITNYRVNRFMRGDTDSDGKYTMNDVVYLVNYLFRGGPDPVPLEAGDVDGSGEINVSDVSYLISYLYGSGPPPPPQ